MVEDMDLADLINTSSGLKRNVKENLENEASTSKKNKIHIAVGAIISAKDNAKVSINNVIVKQHIHQQQPIPQQPPSGIKLQVANPIDSFRGRHKQLQDVKDIFNKQKDEKYNLVVVSGYGGIGKTEFARKYMQKNISEFENVLWIYAEFKETMEASFNKLQQEIKNRGYPCSDHQYVYNYLNNAKYLFVFDNAENMMNIIPFLPDQSNDSLFLITSQFQNWSPYTSIILDILDLESAKDVIKAILETHKIEISENQLQAFVSIFEPIPIVLQIIAGFVCEEIIGLRDINKEYNIDEIIELLSTECELVTQEFPPFFKNSYAKSVFQALSKTLDKIWTKKDKASILTAQILGISAHLSADHIKENMLKELVKENKSTYLFNKSLVTLQHFSLLQVSYNIRIHRIVQECILYYCEQKLNTHEYYSQTLYLLLSSDYSNWPHHKMILQRVENYLETFWTFYDANKCRSLYQNMAKSISYQTLQLIIVKFDLIHNPEFLCEVAATLREDVLQVLQNNAANFNIIDKKGFSALYYACLPIDEVDNCDYYFNSILSNTWIRIQALIKSKANVNSPNLEGNTIIHNLCNLGKNCTEKDEYIFELCTLMITVGGDPKMKNIAGQTPVDLAREYGLKITFELLNAVISGNTYILHLVAEFRKYDFLGFLTRDKIYDINEKDNTGCTVLHVLASLTQLDAEDEKYEQNLLYNTASLLDYCDADIDVSIANNAGETAPVVALRHGRKKLADLFNTWITPGHYIYRTDSLYSKLQLFPFVGSKDKHLVNEQNDTGCTLLHAICELEVNDYVLDLDIVNLAAHLVIWGRADVYIKNHAGDTAADIARRHNILLADFLDLRRNDEGADVDWCCNCCRKFDGLALAYVGVQYKLFDLVKSAWWRYCYFSSATDADRFPDESACAVLHTLCDYKDPDVTDDELIRVIEDLNLKLLAEYDEFEYHAAVGIAKQNGRDKLTAWLATTSICDINDRDDSGCTELHRLSDNPEQNTEVEIRTFNKLVNLVINCDADVSVVNNAGETAAGVAGRCNRKMFMEFLNARTQPGRIIYQTDVYRSKIEHFSFVRNEDSDHVNEQDDNRCTLLHVLCDLNTNCNTELELEIVKLAIHLVIRHRADVFIKNSKNETVIDIAQRRGQKLLADLLYTHQKDNLVYVALKHKQFDLVKYTWWRYMYSPSTRDMFGSLNAPGFRMLLILSALEDLNTANPELDSLIDYFDYMKHVMKYYTTKKPTELGVEKDISSNSSTDTDDKDKTDNEDDPVNEDEPDHKGNTDSIN